MHTNPIIICFCSILYYKNLGEHLRRYQKQRRALVNSGEFEKNVKIELTEFTGRLPDEESVSLSLDDDASMAQKRLIRKKYKTIVVIRWHLFLTMTLNKEIIKYRKRNNVKEKKGTQESLINKIKKRIITVCQRRQESSF